MIGRYGGIDVDLGHLVYIVDLNASRPVFHRPDLARHPDAAACGIALYERGWLADASRIPPRHAVKFARPCARCWPELRRVLAIPRPRSPQGSQERIAA